MHSPRIQFALFASSMLIMIFCVNVCDAQSLFERRDPSRMEPFSNFVARAKGDLLVVLINENTDVENRDERSLDRQGSSSSNAGLNYGLTGNLGQQQGAANFGSTSDGARAFTGDSEFRSERQFQDRFTVTVVDVLPNGNMLIKGKRSVVLQGDKRTLELTGVVRNLDVLPNNVVSSQLVANLEIRLLANGPEEEFGRQGWLGRRLGKFLPF